MKTTLEIDLNQISNTEKATMLEIILTGRAKIIPQLSTYIREDTTPKSKRRYTKKRTARRWTLADIATLKAMHRANRKTRVMARTLHRTPQAIYSKINELHRTPLENLMHTAK
jgi:hypothetical protein